jgi:CHAT domain/AAA ATPase domain
MRTVKLRVGALDLNADAYPIELFDFASGVRLTRDPSNIDWLPRGFIDSAAIRTEFTSPNTLPIHLRHTGQRFFEALHRGEVAALWDAERAAHASTLIEVVDGALRDLPWELLANDTIQYFGRTPAMARYHTAPILQDQSSPWPLRLLVIIGSDHLGPTGSVEELRRLRTDLLAFRHSIDLEVCSAQTPGALVAELKDFQPHFIHYIGHSGLSPRSGLAALYLQGGTELDAQQIGTVLNQSGARPRFVFLNACRTAGAAPLALASAFAVEGVPALLTMQGEIQGDLAGQFAARMYKAMWCSMPIDDAVSAARTVLANVGTPQTWAFPVLSLAVSPDIVSPPRSQIDKVRERHIDRCPVFHEVRLFSGRSRERRDLRRAFSPLRPVDSSHHLKVITGESKHGKSYLVKRCLEQLALGGHNVQYVEVADCIEKTFVDVALNLLQPDAAHGAAPIPEQIQDQLRWDVHCILTYGATRPWDGTRIPGRIEFRPDQQKAEDPVKAVFEALFKALERASAQRPLLIVLDHFRSDPQAPPAVSKELFRDILWPQLFEPIMTGALPSISIVLVMLTSDFLDSFGIDNLVPADQWLKVSDFDPNSYQELAAELVGYPSEPELPIIAQYVRSRTPNSAVTLALRMLAEIVERADKDTRRRVGFSR